MAPPPRTLWVVANGHGEDAIAAALLMELRTRLPDWSFVAFPVVGVGTAFEDLDVPIRGPRVRLPADGLTLHHPSLLWADLRAGLLQVSLQQVRALWAGRADAVLVVGDVYAQGLARLLRGARRFVVQPLVSIRLAEGGGLVPWNRAFMERIRAPERALLRRAEAVYPRDEATAAWLRARGVGAARFLGNPMMDGLSGQKLRGSRPGATLALLPGSRAYAERALLLMAAGMAALADAGAPCVGWVAWTRGDPPPPPTGWTSETVGDHDGWGSGDVRVGFVTQRFPDVLASADAVLGTAGTAQEQAAGLGLPVVAFPVEPAYGGAFLANQKRLLGGALQVVESDPARVAAGLRRALHDPAVREAARRDGPERLGPPGGTSAIAADVAARLSVAS
ncbi:MAG: lipid-A-disaccharide synthase-related protein [Trueperaceae bacterium]